MDLTNLNLNKDRNKLRRLPSVDLGSMVYGKIPPQAKDLEEAGLGAIMLESSAFDTVVEILKPECFYLEGHQRIFRAMQGLAQKSQPIDILTVVEELRFRQELEVIGGASANGVSDMAKLIFGMNQSLDGYVDHMKLPPPEPVLFRHWIEQVRGLSGSVYGRVIYGLMRYWDDDQPGWGEAEHEFAAAWRAMVERNESRRRRAVSKK